MCCATEIKMTKDNDALDIPASLKREENPVDPTLKAPPNTAKAKPVKIKPAAKQSKKASRKASHREGLVTVVAIAKEYKLTRREARAALREAKLKKPAVGWAFAPNSPELKRVREVLKAAKEK
jgi:hypothetical protein